VALSPGRSRNYDMSQKGITRDGGALFADDGPDGLLHRAFLRGESFSADDVRKSPVIGIASSWSELNPCNAGLRDVAEAVKRGIEAAGGIGLVFPTISLSEPFIRPTSMYLRNLMSMDVEEMTSSSPIDGVVLLGGCDKTVPAQLMGALSANKPAVMVVAGPRPTSCWKERTLTIDDVWPLIDERRTGDLSDDDWAELEGVLNVGVGSCNVLGTATTMAAIAEVLGFALPGSALLPAASESRRASAEAAGRAIVSAVAADRRPKDLVNIESLENAFRAICALGGSTNAVIHLEAIAGRAGLPIGIARMREWASSTPLLTDVRPAGTYLLADLENAGGIPAVLRELAPLLHLDTLTASGEKWRQLLTEVTGESNSSLRTFDQPVSEEGGIAILSGSLAPGGAVLKTAAASVRSHRGRAFVFDGVADLNERIDDDALDVDASSVLILRGVGVLGAPGMPEVGHIPIPKKLVRQGVRDMMRLTDARMSGTATGTVIVHISPEAAAGGPIGLVRDGDLIEVDVAGGRIDLLVDPAVLATRTAASVTPSPTRGYGWLYRQHALQPADGCDFDFLRPDFDEVTRGPVND
jgi:dihydroxy-acid dehydratase